jgi:hypothetical protein
VIRYNDMTPERLACLKAIAAAPTGLDHDDPVLAPFCDDRSTLRTPDVFNQCHDAGWLKTDHDSRLDCSFVELTAKGIAALKTAQGKQAGE